MKVLEISEYLSYNLSRISSGYGYMVADIAISISQFSEVDIYTLFPFSQSQKIDKCNVIKKSTIEIVKNIGIRDILNSVKYLSLYPPPFKKIIQTLFSSLSVGYIRKLVKLEKYDIIHIHGITLSTYPVIKFCLEENLKFVVTIHGLNFHSSIILSKSEKKLEIDVIELLELNDLSLTLISSGLLNKIREKLPKIHPDFMTIIPNGIPPIIIDNVINIRKSLNIPTNKYVIICVGSISVNKNQVQLIRSVALLPNEIKEEIVIIFIGNNSNDSELLTLISNYKLQHITYFTGLIEKKELYNYYQKADLNVVISQSEGFGLSIIEAMCFGVPSLMFSDLDAFEDVYSPNVIIPVRNRTDQALSKGLMEAINKNWEKLIIIEYSNRFTLDIMASSYITHFEKILTNA